ncbi:MAG: MucB/RseB C-terminal domain-containing protein [Sulfuricella sp.]|nr:MucB/RseB C-terminal domain-containing protein [Sulfuricella sp.]
MRALFLVTALFVLSGASQAETTNQADALETLKKVAAAAHQLNYSGTFIYQYGDRVETSRIAHLRNESGEHEKVEALDGAPREVVRNNGEVLCFRPDSDASIVVEKRRIEKSFPALLPRRIDAIGQNYKVRFAEQDRIAGHVCDVLVLEPKDQYRYRLKLWSDHATGLLLKASTLNEKNEVIGQFAFTQLTIGGPIDREALKPRISGRKVVISNSPAPATELHENDLDWAVKPLLPGFSQVTAMKRTMPGKEAPVDHLVFSDGLATVSVFIEPVEAGMKTMQGVARQGATNFYTRTLANHQITVLGEVPAVTVMQIGNAVVNTARAASP